MRAFGAIAFVCALRQASCEESALAKKVLHALPEFVTGDMLAALTNSVRDQFDKGTAQQRCLPSSCVLPQAEVKAFVGEKLRQALALAENTPTAGKKIALAAPEGTNMYLPALRTNVDEQGKADFHDDFDVDEPQKEATWTALLYLDASVGDRFMVRLRDQPEHVESQEIKPGTLILFKSSEVQHTATGTTHESRRLALGPVALDQAGQDSGVVASPASTDSFRARILSWGSGGSGSSGSSRSGDIQYALIAVVVALSTMGIYAF
jgi:hypothetical protein